jgi:hypothetical protein
VRNESRGEGYDGLREGIREDDGLSFEHHAGQEGLGEDRESPVPHSLMALSGIVQIVAEHVGDRHFLHEVEGDRFRAIGRKGVEGDFVQLRLQ